MVDATPIGQVLTTPRLRLEPCHPEHFGGLQALNADPVVMRYITGRPETPRETAAMIERVQARWAKWGYSWFSFIERDSGEVIGAGCIQNLRRSGTEPDANCPLEIGWRLRQDRWHRGLAIEAAEAMATFAFDTLGAPTLYAVCDPDNPASLGVMRRLGMRERGLEHWYERPLTTCEITAAEWRARHSKAS
jgi:RimJ/RimL family protein N-acetyltransferase